MSALRKAWSAISHPRSQVRYLPMPGGTLSSPVRRGHDLQVTGGALDERRERAGALAHDEAAFAVAGLPRPTAAPGGPRS